MNINELITLAKHVGKANPSMATCFSYNNESYSYEQGNEALRLEFKALAPDYRTFCENENAIFRVMESTIEDVVPARVLEQYSQFADIKTFRQGEKPIFIQKITTASRRRAKQFIGRAGVNGLYEVFKLDGRSYEVTTNALGGAAQIGFEEFLDGRVNFADVLDILMEGLDECIYVEIEKQLIGAVKNVQKANKYTSTTFEEAYMDELIAKADSYGKATLYCTFEFAATMWPSDNRMSDDMKAQRWNNGYSTTYKGHSVVVLPQSYEDEKNKVKVIDPSYCFIIPVGAEKPVKIAFEGGTIMQRFQGYDQSMEIHAYKKVGVRAIFSNAICVYRNTSLTRSSIIQ